MAVPMKWMVESSEERDTLDSLVGMIPNTFLLAIDECAPLVALFRGAGRRLYLVGGVVRDGLIGTLDEIDFDLTTDATPDEVEALLRRISKQIWSVGKRFGTVGVELDGRRFEITTHRSETYVSDSRKPEVTFSTSIVEDLSRRDFTINAMAVEITSETPELVDPFNGFGDMAAKILRTPIEPEISFSEDPLRTLRAARFIARFDLEPVEALTTTARELGGRLSVVSRERIRDELDKLLVLPNPLPGLEFLTKAGLFEHFLPEVPALALEQDPIHRHKDVLSHTFAVVAKSSPERILRLSALLHDIGKPKTRQVGSEGVSFHFHDVVGAKMARKRMSELKYANDDIDDVCRLIELHLRFHTYGAGWSDSAVRRYVRDAGHLYDRLNELTMCDATTRNTRKLEIFRSRMEELEARVSLLREQEEMDSIRPEFDGNEVMEILGINPSKVVGEAMEFLLEIRLEEGMIGRDELTKRLLNWWDARPR